MFWELGRIMRRGISWFAMNIKHPINISDTIEKFSKQIDKLTGIISKLLLGIMKTRFFSRIEYYTSSGIEKTLAKSVATLEILVSAFNNIHIAKQNNTKNENITNLYFESGTVFSIDWLRQSCEAQINELYWN